MAKVRVVKLDNRNWSVEKREEGEWRSQGIYCVSLDKALAQAVKLGMPNGEVNESLRLFLEATKQIEVLK